MFMVVFLMFLFVGVVVVPRLLGGGGGRGDGL